jgi:hypothetical protein
VTQPVPEPFDESTIAHLFTKRPDFAATTFTLLDLNGQMARHYGLDPLTCAACCWIESGFDPAARGDWTYGGNPRGVIVAPGTPGALPTSFGWYQLHLGGEMPAGVPTSWAEDPVNCSNVAMAEMAGVMRATGLTGGALVAAAQRPADPAQYAQDVDEVMQAISSGHPPEGFLAASGVSWTGTQPFPPAPPPAPKLPDVDTFVTANPNPGGGDYLCSWSTRRAVGIPSEPVLAQVLSTGVEQHNIDTETFAYFTPELWPAPKDA